MKAVIKSSLILPAVFVCGLGVALFVRANLGSDPVTMLEIALAQITTLSLGQAALYFEGFIFQMAFGWIEWVGFLMVFCSILLIQKQL